MMRSDLEHSWEQIHKALQKIEETVQPSAEANPPPVVPKVQHTESESTKETKHGAQEIEEPAEGQLVFVMAEGCVSSLTGEGSIREIDRVAVVDQPGQEDQHYIYDTVQEIEIVTIDECKTQGGQSLPSSSNLCLEHPLEGNKG
jgi:hypothetical protein